MTLRPLGNVALGAAACLILVVACQARREAEPGPSSASSPGQGSAAPAEPAAAAPAPPPPPGAANEPSAVPTSAAKEEQKPAKRDDLLKDSNAGPRTPEEAQAAFERAKSELDTLLGNVSGGRAATATPLASSDTRCPDACKAFASLERAADAVCRLTSDKDPRCSRARDVVKTSRARVDACKCAPADD